jgi:hypothetical protein
MSPFEIADFVSAAAKQVQWPYVIIFVIVVTMALSLAFCSFTRTQSVENDDVRIKLSTHEALSSSSGHFSHSPLSPFKSHFKVQKNNNRDRDHDTANRSGDSPKRSGRYGIYDDDSDDEILNGGQGNDTQDSEQNLKSSTGGIQEDTSAQGQLSDGNLDHLSSPPAKWPISRIISTIACADSPSSPYLISNLHASPLYTPMITHTNASEMNESFDDTRRQSAEDRNGGTNISHSEEAAQGSVLALRISRLGPEPFTTSGGMER